MNKEHYQIGDLVHVDLGIYGLRTILTKVVAVNAEENTIKVESCNEEYKSTFDLYTKAKGMLRPILLSEDLLEALGITDQSDNKRGDYRTGRYLSVLMPGGLLMWNDFGIRKVKYLHELQHTMRGLGLPEIDYSKLLNYVDKRKD